MKKFLCLAGFSAIVLTACYKDNVDELYPGNGLFTPCDTTSTMSYATHIVPIMENYCYSCHSGSNPSSGFRIDNYTALRHYALTNGELVGRIRGSGSWNQMPQNFSLDECQLRQIEIWVAAGAPNN